MGQVFLTEDYRTHTELIGVRMKEERHLVDKSGMTDRPGCLQPCSCVCVTGEQIRKRRCKAAFSYFPQNEDELELKIGDVIEVIGEVRQRLSLWV